MMGERIYPGSENLYEKVEFERHLAAYRFAEGFVKSKDVLDAGCGSGYGTFYLSDLTEKIVGVDASPEAIGYANEHYRKGNLEYRCMSLEELDLQTECFDIVLCLQGIEHLEDPNIFLEKAKNVLKKDGIMIVATPNRLLRLADGEKPWNPYHRKEYSPEELLNILKRHFEEVEIMGLFGKNSVHHLEVSRSNPHTRKFRFRTVYDHLLTFMVKLDFLQIRRFFSKNIRNQVVDGLMKKKEQKRKRLLERVSADDFVVASQNVDDALDVIAVCRHGKR